VRVLVIGNSHAACVIEAWRLRRDRETAEGDLQLDFLARAGSIVDEVGVDGERLFALTPEGKAFQHRLGQRDSFALAEYDAIAVIGQELSIFHLVGIVGRTHVLGWDYGNRRDFPVITRAALRDALSDAIDDSGAATVLRRLGPVAAARGIGLLAVTQPFPARAILEDARGAGIAMIIRAGIGGLCREMYETVAAARMSALGAGFVPQPPQSVVDDILTDRAFTAGAKRLVDLTKSQPKGDVLHANAAYGASVIDLIAKAVAAG
jgi:hypothetical protein